MKISTNFLVFYWKVYGITEVVNEILNNFSPAQKCMTAKQSFDN